MSTLGGGSKAPGKMHEMGSSFQRRRQQLLISVWGFFVPILYTRGEWGFGLDCFWVFMFLVVCLVYVSYRSAWVVSSW
ncbi:hypothetical protein BJX99DRAFT_216935 [Aspergillus californicus]